MHRKLPWLAATALIVTAGCPTRDISKLDPAPAIEYRHIPDPADIERVIVPLIRKGNAEVPAIERQAS